MRRSVSRKCGGIFDIEGKRQQLTAHEARMSEADFWNRQESAQQVLSEVKALRGWLDPYDKLTARLESARELDELLRESPDPEMDAELDRELESLDGELDSFEMKTLLRGEDDFRDAQVEISAGAGGTEAQDWAQMLLRMYVRWAERKGFEMEILDESHGVEAGIKGAVIEIRGA